MANEKCKSCKHHLVEYSKWYHMPVEGCDTKSNKPYPYCYEKREDADNTRED